MRRKRGGGKKRSPPISIHLAALPKRKGGGKKEKKGEKNFVERGRTSHNVYYLIIVATFSRSEGGEKTRGRAWKLPIFPISSRSGVRRKSPKGRGTPISWMSMNIIRIEGGLLSGGVSPLATPV